MSRVINTNSPGKRRNHQMRTIAEMLRHLGQKKGVDGEARDMAATIVFALRDINDTVLESIEAWEKRNYWKKADDFQQKWWWAGQHAQALDRVVRDGEWDKLPDAMMKLFPHFADIEVNKLMRKPDTWQGAYDELMAEEPKS